MRKILNPDETVSIIAIINIFKERILFFLLIILVTFIPQIYFQKTNNYLAIFYDYNKIDPTIKLRNHIDSLKNNFILPYFKKKYEKDNFLLLNITEEINVGFENPNKIRPYGLDRIRLIININDYPELNTKKEIKSFLMEFNNFLKLSLESKKIFVDGQLKSTIETFKLYKSLGFDISGINIGLVSDLLSQRWFVNNNYNNVYFDRIFSKKISIKKNLIGCIFLAIFLVLLRYFFLDKYIRILIKKG